MSSQEPSLGPFLVNLSNARVSLASIEAEIDRIDEGVNLMQRRLSEKMGGAPPIVHLILSQITDDPKDLHTIAKVLGAIAPEIAKRKELERQRTFLNLAIENPHFIAATVGDFSDEASNLQPEHFAKEDGPK